MKISIIVPLYNTEKYISRCLESIMSQTYENIEIIVVNDCSTDKSEDIVKSYAKKDNRIKLVKHSKNKGLFHARITGVENATGDYIGFVDSDDFVSCDYFRTMMENAQENESDIVVSRLVHIDENGYKYIHNMYHYFDIGILKGDDIRKKYWEQEGKCFIWHTVWNKIYRKSLWDKAITVLRRQTEHLIMAEDFVFSSVLINFAEKLSCVNFGCYFYFQHSGASTSLNGNKSKFIKNLNDLRTSFGFVKMYITSGKYKFEAEDYFKRWSNLYRYYWKDNIGNTSLNDNDKDELYHLLDTVFPDYGNSVLNPSYFYINSTEYDSRYDDIIDRLNCGKIKCLSFDIFDTAIVRPFYTPTDLFITINNFFAEMRPQERRTFSEIRIMAESETRKKKIYCAEPELEDISIYDIYSEFKVLCPISDDDINILIAEEFKAEKKYCRQRKSIKNLYDAAISLGIKICFTTDMYWDSRRIKEILCDNGYSAYDELIISNEKNASKRNGSLYKILIELSECRPEEIMHIGDNWESDVVKSQEFGISNVFYPKAIDCIQYNISDIPASHTCCAYTEPVGSMINYEKAIGFFGTRTALAVAAIKIYDNPFISFNPDSEVNGSALFLGYYVLGMHLLGITKWISETAVNEKYDKLVFISRDGYLLKEAYEIMRKYYSSAPAYSYFFTSRKAAMPCGIRSGSDMLSLYSCINPSKCTYLDFINMMRPVISDKIFNSEIADKLNEPIETFTAFSDMIKVIDRYFDSNKAKNFGDAMSEYCKEFFLGRTATVDIGYSGRTQELLKLIVGKSVDTFYIHTNDDKCRQREKKCGFKTHCYYDFTPAITGGAREYLFSECSPSCIGYEVKDNDVIPLFDDQSFDYAEKYIIGEIQKNALLFVKDFCDIFGDRIDDMEMRAVDISYPYEFFLHTLTEFDAKMFSCCPFEDDMWAGKTFGLSDYWSECIRYHKIVPYYATSQNCSAQTEGSDFYSRNYAYDMYIKMGIDKKGLLSKGLYWFVTDKSFFKRRIREHLGKK